jgi:hypothetical protein
VWVTAEQVEMPALWVHVCRVVSSTGALELEEVPEELVVVGGGVIGLELGSVWCRLGSKVTVIEFTDNIVPSMDADLRRAFQRTLQKQGLPLHCKHPLPRSCCARMKGSWHVFVLFQHAHCGTAQNRDNCVVDPSMHVQHPSAAVLS